MSVRPPYPRAKSYVMRHEFIVNQCRGLDVLDVGSVAAEPGESLEMKVERFNRSLFLKIKDVARSLTGLDIDAEAVARIRDAHPDLRFGIGNVETIETIEGSPFDVIIVGDVIEHLSNPGLALTNLKRFLKSDGKLIVSTPNAFGAPNFLRFSLGRFVDGADHVSSYTRFTLTNIMRRHRYEVLEVHTAMDRPPQTAARRIAYQALKAPLKLMPEFGGTLVMVCRPLASTDGA
jgi:2-polyprenyl-3-methyl-5-hydroxy-6-metoxy-1,4-benzoquinol methylase